MTYYLIQKLGIIGLLGGYEDFAESENALRIYNDINDSLDNNKGFKEKLLFTRDSFNFYILYPASLMKYPRIKEYAS